MPRVQTENIIDAPIAEVWKMAQDVEKMPEFMSDLVWVKVLEEQQTSPVTRRTVTEWMGRIKQFNRNVHWTEEDIWNSEEMVCHFFEINFNLKCSFLSLLYHNNYSYIHPIITTQ